MIEGESNRRGRARARHARRAPARLAAALPGLRRRRDDGRLPDGAQACPVCGTELFHHRADDGPAWATILITGHLLAPLMLVVFITWRPQGWRWRSASRWSSWRCRSGCCRG